MRLVGIAELRNRFIRNVLDHVRDIIVQVVAVKHKPALFVYELALSVDDIVVFKRSLSARKVVAFNFLLRVFDGVRKEFCFYRLILGNVESLGDHRKSVAREKAEQIVFKRNVEAAFSGVALTSRTAAKLIVYTSGLVSFRTYNAKTARVFNDFRFFVNFIFEVVVKFGISASCFQYFLVVGFRKRGRSNDVFVLELLFFHLLLCHVFRVTAKRDIRSAPRHVGCYRNRALASRLCDYRRFFFMVLRVQNVMLDAFAFEKFAQ